MPPMALTGMVTKVGYMQKTATVTVSRWMVHTKTRKRIERSKKYLTHDPENSLKMGDTVLIRNCPPISARKRFVLEEILKSPETEWEQAHKKGDAGTTDGDGQAQGPLDMTAGGAVLEELRRRRAGLSSPSKLAQEGMAGVLGGDANPAPSV